MLYLVYFIVTAYTMIFLTHKKQAGIVVFALTLIYVIFSYPSGNDWLGYFTYYDCSWNSVCNSDPVNFEPGYNLVVNSLGFAGYYVLTIIITCFVLTRLYLFCRFFDKPALIFFFFMAMFLWVMYFEAIRQALAFTFILSAIVAIYKREKLKALIIITIAGTFHVTALVFLIMIVPLLNIKLANYISRVFLIIAIIFMFIPEQLILVALSYLPVNSFAATKLYFYINTEQYKPQLSIGIGSFFDIILMYIIYQTSKIFKSKNQSHYNIKGLSHSITMLGITLFLCFAIFIGKVMPVLTRVGWYFFPFVAIYIYVNFGNSYFFDQIKTNKARILRLLMMLFITIQVIRPFIYEISQYNLVNQKSIFQKLDSLSDDQLRIEAENKCKILYDLNAGFLCSL